MTSIYTSGAYLAANPSWHAEDSPWKAKQISTLLSKNRLSPTTVCEVGCGAGEVIRVLSEEMPAASFVGYEISPQAYERCSRLESDRRTFRLGDVLADQDQSFDVMLFVDVIEHIEDYHRLLRETKCMSRYKVLHIPLDLSVQTVARSTPLVAGRRSIGHIHYFTKDIALSMLRELGYSVIDHVYTAGGLELPGRGLGARLLRPIRRVAFRIDQDLAVRFLAGFSLLVLVE